MPHSKAQVTLFFMVGILIIATVALMIYVFSDGSDVGESGVGDAKALEAEASSVSYYIQSCLKSTSVDAIVHIGEHGGYYDLGQVPHVGFPADTAYYFYEGRDAMPSVATVEDEISEYVEDNIFFCLRSFAGFEDKGLDISQADARVFVSLMQDHASIGLDMLISVRKGELVRNIRSFEADVSSRLGAMLESAAILTKEQTGSPKNICMSCILRESTRNGFVISLANMGDDTVIVSVLDNETGLVLSYANQYALYSCQNPPPDADSPFYERCLDEKIGDMRTSFHVEDIADLDVVAGENFSYIVNASGYNVSFFDYTDLFDIGRHSGTISFVPDASMVGEHKIWLLVTDQSGSKRYISFGMRIRDGD